MKHDLALVGCVEFREEDYPGYRNKKGSEPECNEPFHLGECSTFKFKFFHYLKKSASGYIHTSSSYRTSSKSRGTTQNQILFDVGYPLVEV
ncbi:hypothetical protein MKW92_005506, partial [Papaver armeniacum]